MDLGLGNLIGLKRHLLAPGMMTQTTFDTVIADLGKAVAAAFEGYCARKFARVVGAQDIFTADRVSYVLTRYPLESISAVDLRDTMAAGWVAQDVNTLITQQDTEAGLVLWDGQAGTRRTLMRITYTGGYWYDTAETENTSQPSGSTLLPADLKGAWFTQCAYQWQVRDKTGKDIVRTGGSATFVSDSLGGLKLVPEVERVLQTYRRFQIT